jgi:uncharacterized protein YktB (UPF0637 family)
MYQFSGFVKTDFDIFLIPEFHDRMSALRTTVRPKLAMLGDDLAPKLHDITGHSMFPHTASHARRRVNPPDDTWVAFSRSERGYKRYAHFEVGLSVRGVFVRFSVKPEGEEDKARLLHYLSAQGPSAFDLKDPNTVWVYENDHGEGPHQADQLGSADIAEIISRTRLKSRGFTAGIDFDRSDPVLKSAEFITRAHNAIRHLSPLYEGVLGATVAP